MNQLLLILLNSMGSGCSTAVEHLPLDREVEDLNPAECWAFSLHYLISSVSFIRSFMGVQVKLVFLEKYA